MNIYKHHYLWGWQSYTSFACTTLWLPIVPRVIVELRNPVDGEREIITVGDMQGLTLSSTSHFLVCTLLVAENGCDGGGGGGGLVCN